MPHSNLAARAGRWSAQHRKTAVLGWLAFVAIAFVIGGMVGTKTLAPEDQGNGSSQHADQVRADSFPKEASESVLVQAKGDGKATDPAFRAAVQDTAARLAAAKDVRDVESPFAKGNEGQISEDGRSALVNFKVSGDLEQSEERVDASLAATAAAQKAHPELRIEQFGDASAAKALNASFEKDFQRAETLSLPITLLILIVAFGALLAAGVPLLLGLTAVMGTLGLLAPISQIVPMADAASSVVLLVGLAVGVDYSMFYLRRKMEERDAGRSNEAALEFAAATSGQAVLVSGVTVLIAMAGMLIAGNAVFTSMAVGTMLVVAVAVLGSVTVLPAVLSKLGDKVEWGRVPVIGKRRHRNHGESRVWGWILGKVLARPVISVVASSAILIALAVPALGMKTINPGVAGIPHDLPVMKTYDRIQAAFPGGPLPAVVVVQADDVTAPAVQQGIKAMTDKALASGQMSQPVTTEISPSKNAEVVSIPMQGDGTDVKSETALATLRDDVIPATIGKVDGAQTDVTGLTAGSKDFNDAMRGAAPVRVRVRPRARVRAAARHVPLDRRAAEGDRAEPAVGRRELRHPHARLPGRARGEPARLRVARRHHRLAAAVPVRDPVRPVDGLPRVHPQPDPRGGRSRRVHERRGRARHPLHRRRRDQRGDGDGRGVRDLRDAQLARVQDDGRRPRGRDPHRRHDRAGGAPARGDDAARRAQLVPPQAAELAAQDLPRRRPRARPRLAPGRVGPPFGGNDEPSSRWKGGSRG